ncbi:MAG TPA: outer membrane beta-barrel protein [Thermoanaerobaculia bacterium]|nr:outer membrane beta-barrel protein [Thermoanaerobaculia bacterium]
MTSKRAIWILAGLLVASAPAWAQRGPYERDGAFRLHIGTFQPEGDSEYWDDVFDEFTGDIDEMENLSIGGDYLFSLNRNFGLLFSGSYYEGDQTQNYIDFVDNFGDEIRHDTTLQIASFTAGVQFSFLGPDAPIIPYVGAGGGLYLWNLEEAGDFIDRNDDIFNATLESEGEAFGYYWQVGLEAPITHRMSVFGEARWTQVEDELDGDFEGFGDIDLSGREFLAGISWSL